MTADNSIDPPQHPFGDWFRLMAANTHTAILVVRDTCFFANPAAERLMGLSASELSRVRILDTVHPDDRDALARRLEKRLTEGKTPSDHQLRIVRPSGEERWVEYTATDIEVEGQRAVMVTAFDFTERQRALEALHQEEERALVTLTSIDDGVIRTDADGRVDFLNPVAEELTGWTGAEAEGRLLSEVYRPVDETTGELLAEEVEMCLRGEEPPHNLLKRLVRSDGAVFTIQDCASPIRSRSGEIQGAVLVFKDLSRERGLEREIRVMATRDRLTGLLNREEFERRLGLALEDARERGGEHVLCYLDLDEFKLVNDVCGHPVGDEMLRQVADILRRSVRARDALARLGGDEFGILLQDCERRRARTQIHEVRQALRQFRFPWGDHRFETGASIGMVPVTAEFETLGELLAAADGACYIAKERGRAQVHEYRPGDAAFAERYGEMQWVQLIHRALEEDCLTLYSQPIELLTGTGELLSEVFLRMVGSNGEIIAPGEFIQAAERYRLVSSIDRWVVRTALETLARAQSSGTTGPLVERTYTINISGQSLGEEGFLEDVVAALRTSGVPPQRVCFELTETSAIGNLGHARLFFSVLRDLGCRFILDDFGSGLSSFAYLKNLPVDFLKIDGEFVSNIVVDPVQRAIVESIHRVGSALNIRTIGEGVEDTPTLTLLQEIGVDYAQGYLLGKPAPMEPEEPGER
ncbi:MAG: EAL domain-containing protein [Acidobacteriota bacterium]|nr:EAL domain-containing protein [Acidobacteriota bacterium]